MPTVVPKIVLKALCSVGKFCEMCKTEENKRERTEEEGTNWFLWSPKLKLLDKFSRNYNLIPTELTNISSDTGIPRKRVVIWFRNERALRKKKKNDLSEYFSVFCSLQTRVFLNILHNPSYETFIGRNHNFLVFSFL